jgi:hypothetical protein
VISLSISLTGDFTDTDNSVPYTYYKNPVVRAIYPRYGPKDGGTKVYVWGEGFINFGNNTRCSFGTQSNEPLDIADNYMICNSTFSDVVQKPIAFTVMLNNQQHSFSSSNFWYYQWNSVVELTPAAGPYPGGTEIVVKGTNMDPFKEYDISNHNDTFAMFANLGKVDVEVYNSTRARIVSLPSERYRETIVEMTLNNQQYTMDEVKFRYFRPPQVFAIRLKQGPVAGGTIVSFIGTDFRNTKNITCKFDTTIVEGVFISEEEIQCVTP